MDQETIVYGIIKDAVLEDRQLQRQARLKNCDALLQLSEVDSFPYLTGSMFSIPAAELEQGTYHTQVIHFAASYQAVEYYWEKWMAKFEALLRSMYWVSVTVHLDTELSGKHTFIWEAAKAYHSPDEDLSARCEWEKEASFASNITQMKQF